MINNGESDDDRFGRPRDEQLGHRYGDISMPRRLRLRGGRCPIAIVRLDRQHDRFGSPGARYRRDSFATQLR
jgi:hypothetical protein